MSERDVFLNLLEKNPDDATIRLVFADWLDERGEHEEADRQRQHLNAIEWLRNVCIEFNAGRQEGEGLTCDQLLDFGRNVSATTGPNIEVSDIPDGHIVSIIRDRIPEFWKAWSIATGLPLTPEVEKKCYYSSGYCCVTEIYPDTHVAGPLSEEFIRADEERARNWRDREQEAEEFQRRSDEERQREFDTIQDELEKDRP